MYGSGQIQLTGPKLLHCKVNTVWAHSHIWQVSTSAACYIWCHYLRCHYVWCRYFGAIICGAAICGELLAAPLFAANCLRTKLQCRYLWCHHPPPHDRHSGGPPRVNELSGILLLVLATVPPLIYGHTISLELHCHSVSTPMVLDHKQEIPHFFGGTTPPLCFAASAALPCCGHMTAHNFGILSINYLPKRKKIQNLGSCTTTAGCRCHCHN